jgi:hypothetical protein
MMLGKKSGFDPKGKAIEELLSHLGMSDDKDLGDAVKPKVASIEVAKIAKPDGQQEPDGDEGMGMPGDQDGDEMGAKKPEMSDEELQELIEALQSKLG